MEEGWLLIYCNAIDQSQNNKTYFLVEHISNLDIRSHLWTNVISFLIILNCPCNLFGSIYHRMHNWAPIVWYIQKCMLIWKICFYFSFVFAICSSKIKTRHVTRDRFTQKKLLRRTIFNDKTKIKSNFPYQNTKYSKRRGAQLCIRWYIDRYRWHG